MESFLYVSPIFRIETENSGSVDENVSGRNRGYLLLFAAFELRNTNTFPRNHSIFSNSNVVNVKNEWFDIPFRYQFSFKANYFDSPVDSHSNSARVCVRQTKGNCESIA